MTLIQRHINVDATSWRCCIVDDVAPTLMRRCIDVISEEKNIIEACILAKKWIGSLLVIKVWTFQKCLCWTQSFEYFLRLYVVTESIEDIYLFTVNAINIFIKCNEKISIFTSAKHEWKFKCFHYTRWNFLRYSLKRRKFSFYFIV